jgi:hypothetical protein
MRDEFRVDRAAVFEFKEKPTLRLDGDRATIRFETKGFCDAAVAIENTQGRVIRHLACGVLGANAPEPFQKGSLQQTLVWDGKDDLRCVNRLLVDRLKLLAQARRTVLMAQPSVGDPITFRSPNGRAEARRGHPVQQEDRQRPNR